MMKVSFETCYRELVAGGGHSANRAYQQWSERQGYEAVVKFVQNFDHEKLFDLQPKDVRKAIDHTEHALGEVPKEHQIPEIENFTCPFALQHLFHRFVERTGDVPTWQRFWRWMSKQARPYWLEPIQPLIESLRDEYTADRIDNAIRWRLGKFYYSALREIDLLTSMHARGIPLRYHVLSDVLLRVDYWIGDTLVCTYFPNPRYRVENGGRKPPAAEFFRDAPRPFRIIDFEVERQGRGRLWLVSEKSKDRLAHELL